MIAHPKSRDQSVVEASALVTYFLPSKKQLQMEARDA